MSEQQESLLPCPFCGGECDPIGWLRGDGVRGPECDECGATASSAEAWNRREAQARSSLEAAPDVPLATHLRNLRSISKTVLSGEARSCMRADMENAISAFELLSAAPTRPAQQSEARAAVPAEPPKELLHLLQENHDILPQWGRRIWETVAEFFAAAPQPMAQQIERCPNCDDTGHVHSIDGQWRGICNCPSGVAINAPPVTQAKPEQAAQPCNHEWVRTNDGNPWLHCEKCGSSYRNPLNAAASPRPKD